MQIQKINPQLNSKNNNQPQFTGLADGAVQALRFLDTNQAWGACAVDLCCMVLPRTITDFSRGPSAGFETMRREASGTVNHASVGPIYGTLAGMLVAGAINRAYGINAKNVFADGEAVELLAKAHHDVLHGKSDKTYAQEIAESIMTKGDDKVPAKGLSDKAKELFANALDKEIKAHDEENVKLMKNVILSDLGEETNLMLKRGGKQLEADSNTLLKNITSLSSEMFKDKAVESFKQTEKFADVKFVKAMKNFGLKRSLVGLLIGSAIGCAIQPLNIYLTKKKTGSDGFVGVEGRTKDNSAKFKALKIASAAAFTTFAISTIMNPLKFAKNGKEFLNKIQYKSLNPTMDQFKLVYGLTIASRLLAARDKDELREGLVKDTIGFSSWLVLGNVVSKFTLKKLDKNLVGKTRDEILFKALKEKGIDTIKDGKALSFKELLAKLPKDHAARGSLKKFNIAQLAGYAFSAIVLGVGIPKLNIYMTKRSEQKRAAERVSNPAHAMYKPVNLAFLSKEIDDSSTSKIINR